MYYKVEGQVNNRKQKGKWHMFEEILSGKIETAIANEYLKKGIVKRMDIDQIKKMFMEIKHEKYQQKWEVDELPSQITTPYLTKFLNRYYLLLHFVVKKTFIQYLVEEQLCFLYDQDRIMNTKNSSEILLKAKNLKLNYEKEYNINQNPKLNRKWLYKYRIKRKNLSEIYFENKNIVDQNTLTWYRQDMMDKDLQEVKNWDILKPVIQKRERKIQPKRKKPVRKIKKLDNFKNEIKKIQKERNKETIYLENKDITQRKRKQCKRIIDFCNKQIKEKQSKAQEVQNSLNKEQLDQVKKLKDEDERDEQLQQNKNLNDEIALKEYLKNHSLDLDNQVQSSTNSVQSSRQFGFSIKNTFYPLIADGTSKCQSKRKLLKIEAKDNQKNQIKKIQKIQKNKNIIDQSNEIFKIS